MDWLLGPWIRPWEALSNDGVNKDKMNHDLANQDMDNVQIFIQAAFFKINFT